MYYFDAFLFYFYTPTQSQHLFIYTHLFAALTVAMYNSITTFSSVRLLACSAPTFLRFPLSATHVLFGYAASYSTFSS